MAGCRPRPTVAGCRPTVRVLHLRGYRLLQSSSHLTVYHFSFPHASLFISDFCLTSLFISLFLCLTLLEDNHSLYPHWHLYCPTTHCTRIGTCTALSMKYPVVSSSTEVSTKGAFSTHLCGPSNSWIFSETAGYSVKQLDIQWNSWIFSETAGCIQY